MGAIPRPPPTLSPPPPEHWSICSVNMFIRRGSRFRCFSSYLTLPPHPRLHNIHWYRLHIEKNFSNKGKYVIEILAAKDAWGVAGGVGAKKAWTSSKIFPLCTTAFPYSKLQCLTIILRWHTKHPIRLSSSIIQYVTRQNITNVANLKTSQNLTISSNNKVRSHKYIGLRWVTWPHPTNKKHISLRLSESSYESLSLYN